MNPRTILSGSVEVYFVFPPEMQNSLFRDSIHDTHVQFFKIIKICEREAFKTTSSELIREHWVYNSVL